MTSPKLGFEPATLAVALAKVRINAVMIRPRWDMTMMSEHANGSQI